MPREPGISSSIITNLKSPDHQKYSGISDHIDRPHLVRVGLLLSSMLTLHGLLWYLVARRPGHSWSSLLHNWDAGWYQRIIEQGFDSASSAFLPLFPFVLKILASSLGIQNSAALLFLGSAFSILCFVASLLLLSQRLHGHSERALGLAALLALTFSPSSFVFHSMHTEALFLLLSLLAMRSLERGSWQAAALWAGFAALTRHQGVFLAIAIGFGAAHTLPRWPERLQRFAAVGIISGALWALAPALHWSQGRGAFPAFAAHEQHWYVAASLTSYFKTFLLANPMQNLRLGSFVHHAFYLLMLGSIWPMLQKRRWVEALYCFLCLAIMPMQGELVDAFRFGAVLFPIFAIWGEIWQRWPRVLAWSSGLAYLTLNILVTLQYANGRWAY